ncbi:MAG: hypothetical protein JWM81_24 [Candidatus Saccharibacteria bacterium]|nr:hypothetical protein [Candidatus Saccharibacteria bacterium]
MIKQQSDDPNVAEAAKDALAIVQSVLAELSKATTYDYGGHILQLGDYDVCTTCTGPIAEAQQASKALEKKAAEIDDPVIVEHIKLAAELLRLEADAAVVRAEFHNGIGTEPILNVLLGFQHQRAIYDDYQHSHHQGK